MRFSLFILLFVVMKVFMNNLIIIGAFAFLDKFGSFIRCEEVYKFPEEFTFGAASASYQIEGAWNEDGKDPSIWDTMTHKFPNLIADKSNADVSADSYRLYRSDVEALKAIGVRDPKYFQEPYNN